ncbi:HAD-like domain-containing protein [Dipodascopsis tothii]|uniref:HAD-like domain-containing protein n=1 Tax=Dipodascopsis tothii TaxID=44089 RepID=UPI0034CDC5B0
MSWRALSRAVGRTAGSRVGSRPAGWQGGVRRFADDKKARPDVTSEPLLSQEAVDELAKQAGSEQEAKNEWADTSKRSTYRSSTDEKRDKMALAFYATTLGAAVGGSLFLSRTFSEEEQAKHSGVGNGWAPGEMYGRAKARFNEFFEYYHEPAFDELLPPPVPEPYQRPYTLVLGLDDLLIHSEWTRENGWRTAKRPGLDYFLGYLSQYYEIVIFSSQYMVYSEKPVMKLDPYRSFISHALYREATRYEDGKLIKDLSLMNRDLGKIVMIDADPHAYALQPDNAIPMKPWLGTAGDRELVKLIPFLEWMATQGIKDVRPVLKSYQACDNYAEEYARREAVVRKKYEEDWRAQQKGGAARFLASLAGGRANPDEVPPMPQDLIRQEGQRGYEEFMKYIREHGEKMLEEEKAKEKEFLAEQKLTLGKILTEGMPKPPEPEAPK